MKSWNQQNHLVITDTSLIRALYTEVLLYISLHNYGYLHTFNYNKSNQEVEILATLSKYIIGPNHGVLFQIYHIITRCISTSCRNTTWHIEDTSFLRILNSLQPLRAQSSSTNHVYSVFMIEKVQRNAWKLNLE